MKTKEKKDLRTKTKEELLQMLKEAKSLLFASKLQLSQMKLKNTSEISRKMDDIARILTVIKEKEILTK